MSAIKKACQAFGKAHDEYWAKHWAGGIPPGFAKVANDALEFAMRAAVLALADNVTEEMVAASRAKIWRPGEGPDGIDLQTFLTDTLRAIAQDKA